MGKARVFLGFFLVVWACRASEATLTLEASAARVPLGGQVTFTATRTPNDGEQPCSGATTIMVTFEGETSPSPATFTTTVAGERSASARFHCDGQGGPPDETASASTKVYDCDAITISNLTMYSINKTGLSVSATVTLLGQPAPGKTVTFGSGALTFPNGSTATTNTNGVATLTVDAGSTPSSALDWDSVIASVYDSVDTTYTSEDHFTLVRVNNPTPTDPSIIDGHLPDNDLYSVVLTFTVTPAIADVPITFSLLGGGGYSGNYPATLEDASTATDANGQATVRLRSSDMREAATVKGTYEESDASTNVTFTGITSVTSGTE